MCSGYGNEKIASQVARRLLWLSIIRFPILHNQNRTKFGSWSLLEFQSFHFGFTVELGFRKLARAASGLGLHTACGRSGAEKRCHFSLSQKYFRRKSSSSQMRFSVRCGVMASYKGKSLFGRRSPTAYVATVADWPPGHLPRESDNMGQSPTFPPWPHRHCHQVNCAQD